MSDVQHASENEDGGEEIQNKAEQQDEGVSAEERAAQMGWKPQTEFNGPDGKFVSAEDFIKRGEDELPILRSNVRKLSDKIHDLEVGAKASASFIAMQNEALKKKAERDMRDAADTGDMEAYDDAKQVLDDVPAPQQEAPAVDHTAAFSADNTWYGVDAEMTAFAQKQSERLGTLEPGLSPEENLAKTAAVTEKHFNTRRSAPSSVDPRPRKPSRSGGKQDYASMPQDQKDMCTQLVKGFGADTHDRKQFETDYAKTYFAANQE